MSEWQILRMNKSPFYKESHHVKYKKGQKQIKPNFKLPPTAYNDLMRYFKANGLNESDGFRQIIWDKLQMVNTFQRRRVFNNVEFIMLIPNTRSLSERNEKARIIALYNTESDFKEEFNHRNGFDSKFNYQYELHHFNEGFFRKEMRIINSTKESPVYRVNQRDLAEWDSLYDRLDELYDLSSNNWYFVRCPLNNYLDVNREGQFQSPTYRGEHEGIYVFDDFNNQRLFCLLNWNYTLETKNIAFDVSFITQMEFLHILEKSDFNALKESYGDLKNSNYTKKKFESYIKSQEEHLDFLKRQYDKL